MRTISKPVHRNIEFALVPVGDAFTLVYARWEGDKAFNWALYTNGQVDDAVQLADDPRDLFRESREMPHAAARSGKGSFSKRKDFQAYLVAMPTSSVQEWAQKGVGFRYDCEYDFKPQKFGAALPDSYTVFWFCGYDHTALNADGSLMNLPITELACASSQNMAALKELVKTDERFSWAEEEFSWVPHNGESNTLIIRLSDEEYDRYLKQRNSGGLYMIFPFLGLDYALFESNERDSDDDASW